MKRAIYAGNFEKDGKPFSIDEAMLSRMADSVQELRSAGIAVPFTNGHDWINPANRLGDVVNAVVEKDEDGVSALFLGVDFVDDKSRDTALKGDVSIGYMGEFRDGRGITHEKVLRHVAATNAPVIPSLGEWQALAASFNGKTTDMDKQLLELLGVEDEGLALEAVKGLQSKITELSAPKVELSHPPQYIQLISDSRISKLDAALAKAEIPPCVHSELVLAFANERTVNLELSHGSTSEGFDLALKIAKLAYNSPNLPASGRSSTPAPGSIALSHDGAGAPDGLDAAIEKLVAARK